MKSPNKIIFFDIDGTLVRGNHLLPMAHLRSVIKANITDGIIFGINTNRPIGQTLPIYRKLKLNGPIITEDGACHQRHDHAPSHAAVLGLHKLNKEVTNLMRMKMNTDKNFIIRVSGNKQVLSDASIPFLIQITPERIYTASIYVRKHGKKNKRALLYIFEWLHCELQKKFPVATIKKIDAHGKIIIAQAHIDRLRTLQKVTAHFRDVPDILVISDDESVPSHFSR